MDQVVPDAQSRAEWQTATKTGTEDTGYYPEYPCGEDYDHCAKTCADVCSAAATAGEATSPSHAMEVVVGRSKGDLE